MGRKQDRHPDRCYIGSRVSGDPVVWIAWPGGGRWMKAKWRPGRWNHGNGLEWGYGGSGPAQLALELLEEATQQPARADRWHQAYKWAVTAQLPRRGWVLHREAVLAVLEEIEQSQAGDPPWSPEDTVTLTDVFAALPAYDSYCPRCQGRGYLVISGDQPGHEQDLPCPDCGATGRRDRR